MTRTRLGRGQSGEGKIPIIIGLLVLAGAIYLLMLTVPPRIDKAQFADFIESKGREYVSNQIKADTMHDAILLEAKKVGIPLNEEGLEITDGETQVIIRAKYELPKKLIGGKVWVQHYEIEKDIPRI